MASDQKLTATAARLAQRWLPPVAVEALKNTFGSVHFEGDFASWADAQKQCEGYAAPAILERVLAGSLAVKEGRAAYERDSLVFHEKAYEWPLLSCLLWATNRTGGKLNVLDFGGALGSSYFQHRAWLEGIPGLRWSIVEQANFVEAGIQHLQDESLRFFTDVESCVAAENPRVLLVSGVLQYLERPHEFLAGLVAHDFDVIILYRTPLLAGPTDRLTLQRVGERIYPATYPAWFFAPDKLLAALDGRYRMVERFPGADRANLAGTKYEGFLFERLKS